jgi:phosphinothricin acetyltransferase
MHDQPGNQITSVRTAEPGDLSQIVDIYNYYVKNSHSTFELATSTVGERVPWFARFSADGPHQMLVAESAGKVIGWACSSDYKERPGYLVSVETTVYVDQQALGGGIGKELYESLLQRLDGKGIHGAYAAIALPNDSSVRLHENFGFRKIGEFREVGYKFDRYWTVAWYEKRINE